MSATSPSKTWDDGKMKTMRTMTKMERLFSPSSQWTRSTSKPHISAHHRLRHRTRMVQQHAWVNRPFGWHFHISLCACVLNRPGPPRLAEMCVRDGGWDRLGIEEEKKQPNPTGHARKTSTGPWEKTQQCQASVKQREEDTISQPRDAINTCAPGTAPF